MTETVTIYPDAWAPDAERYSAYFDPERTPYGHGATPVAAALDLYHTSETPEETLACIVAIMRADLEAHGGFAVLEDDYRRAFTRGFESAIRCVEGIDA